MNMTEMSVQGENDDLGIKTANGKAFELRGNDCHTESQNP